MGLIKALKGAAGGTLADQWKEYFYCEAIPADVLAVKGQKKVSDRSSNTKGNDNIISNGSVIAVADGQCMLIVEQGKVVDVCAEPGEYTYDCSTEPSLFAGNLADSIGGVLSTAIKRVTVGGEAPKDQRVYYFNTKEIIGNKYGTPSPVPFRVVDNNIGLDMDIAVKCFGEYSYKIVNPITFYTNICGNFADEFNRSEIDSTLKSELLTALQPAFGRISEMGIRYSAVTSHTTEIRDALKAELSQLWGEQRGIEIANFGVSSIKADEEDEKMIKDLQRSKVLSNPNMAGGYLAGAQGQAMQDAANNTNGAMAGFMGMGMAQNAGGMNAANLFTQGATQPQQPQQAAPAGSWTCSCGTVNTGNFCANCGSKKPGGMIKCDKCGWSTTDLANAPKFCPNCGDPITDADKA